jgi:hypothetical protein
MNSNPQKPMPMYDIIASRCNLWEIIKESYRKLENSRMRTIIAVSGEIQCSTTSTVLDFA